MRNLNLTDVSWGWLWSRNFVQFVSVYCHWQSCTKIVCVSAGILGNRIEQEMGSCAVMEKWDVLFGHIPEGQEFSRNIKAKGLKNRLLLCRGMKIMCIFYIYFDGGYLLDMNQFQMVETDFHVDRGIFLLLPIFFWQW